MFSIAYRHSKTQFHSVSFQNIGPLGFASRDETRLRVFCPALETVKFLLMDSG
jgi:hypothetical protein